MALQPGAPHTNEQQTITHSYLALVSLPIQEVNEEKLDVILLTSSLHSIVRHNINMLMSTCVTLLHHRGDFLSVSVYFS